MKNLTAFIDQASQSPFKLWFLNRVLKRLIPFNAPHGICVEAITPDAVITTAPYKRCNWNHIKGIHACCMATMGEFSAGLQLLRCFNAKTYRLIMAKMEVTYHYQGKKRLYAKTVLDQSQVQAAQIDLEKEDKALLTIETAITNSDDQAVATVRTTWQIKDWQAVCTK